MQALFLSLCMQAKKSIKGPPNKVVVMQIVEASLGPGFLEVTLYLTINMVDLVIVFFNGTNNIIQEN